MIAEKGDISGTSVTVTLSGARFSDGSSVSPQDVVYSFNKAKASSRYGQLLSNIQSAKASGGAVTFTLSSPDPYVLNALSFPVVKTAQPIRRKYTDRQRPLCVQGRGVFQE